MLSTMPSSLQQELSEWLAHSSCRRTSSKMAGGFIRHGSLWALDGAVTVAHLAMKARNHEKKNSGSFATWVTPRAVLACPGNEHTTQ